MQTLINMKLSPEEVKEYTAPSPDDAPKYPWGLELRLEDDQLTKLGLTELPKTGTAMQLTARVEVCSTSEHDSQSGVSRCLSLQVTDMALAPVAASDATAAAQQLYGGSAHQ